MKVFDIFLLSEVQMMAGGLSRGLDGCVSIVTTGNQNIYLCESLEKASQPANSAWHGDGLLSRRFIRWVDRCSSQRTVQVFSEVNWWFVLRLLFIQKNRGKNIPSVSTHYSSGHITRQRVS